MAGLCVAPAGCRVATSPQFFCGWAGVIVSRLRRLPFVLEIRDIWPESIVSVGAMKKGLAIRFLEWMERKMYAAARHIVTVGDGYKEQLIAKGVAADKITVITNGVDREMFRPREPDAELKQKFGLEDAFVCSYIGTIGMACGLDVVLRAARILKARGRNDIRFLLVGDGAVREDLEKRARAEELDNVVFTGLQPKHRIPAFLSITDASLIHLARNSCSSPFSRPSSSSLSPWPNRSSSASGATPPQLLQEAGAGICIEPENERRTGGRGRTAWPPTGNSPRKYGQAGLRICRRAF